MRALSRSSAALAALTLASLLACPVSAQAADPPGMDLTRQGFAAERTRDFATAARLYREASELGNFYAQHLLGHMYEDGRHVPKNLGEAYRLYRLAADQGHPDSNHHIGMMHLSGNAASRDRAQAIAFLRRSAELGYLPGKQQLGQMGLMSEGEGENAGLVNYFIEYAEAQRSAGVFDVLAEAYKVAKGGLPFDFARAAFYTRRAEAIEPNSARQKSLEELDKLAALQAVAGQPGRVAETVELAQYFETIKRPNRILPVGSQSPPNPFLAEARKHHLQAAALGDPHAMLKAAELLRDSDAGATNEALANEWREKGLPLLCQAAQNGDRQALRQYERFTFWSREPCPISDTVSVAVER